MPVSAATLRVMMDAGLAGDQLLAVVAAVDADMETSRPSVDEAGERRRSADRERMRIRRVECEPETWNELRRTVFERDGWQCVYCGSSDNLEADHIVPLSKGGRSTLDNLSAACKSCNSSKGARLVEEWLSCQ